VTLAVVSSLTDLAMDLVTNLLPALQGRVESEALGEPHATVEHHPSHYLGVRVMAARSARFPDPIVGLAPNRLDVFDDRAPARPAPCVDTAEELRGTARHADYLPINVELELFGRRIADPDRPGPLVAGKLVEVELHQTPLVADPYMIWILAGSPVPIRAMKSRKPSASSVYPPTSSASSANTESRSQD
jgi:hypothetical protein